jgi:GNAT superfamily N-acetyltransferase
MWINRTIRRFMLSYKRKGFMSTLYRIIQFFYRILFKSKTVLFYTDFYELDNSILKLPQDIVIECKTKYYEALQSDMKKIINYWEDRKLMDETRERFEKGAILWVLKLKDEIAGFGWAIRGKMVSTYYLPLAPNDAVLFDFLTFEEYRGHGLYALLCEKIMRELKLEGVVRAYGMTDEWNTSSIRGLEKTFFKKFIITRKFHVLSRNLTIWSYADSSLNHILKTQNR